MRVDGVRGRGRCLCPLLFPLIPFVGNGGVEWSDHLFYICPFRYSVWQWIRVIICVTCVLFGTVFDSEFEWSTVLSTVLHLFFSLQCLTVMSEWSSVSHLSFLVQCLTVISSDCLFYICPFRYSVWQWGGVHVCLTSAPSGYSVNLSNTVPSGYVVILSNICSFRLQCYWLCLDFKISILNDEIILSILCAHPCDR